MATAKSMLELLDWQGYLGPLPLASASSMDAIYADYASLTKNPKNRHIENSAIQQLYADAAIQSILRAMGWRNYVLWRTHFFAKGISEKTNREIGWHHDKHFQQGEEQLDFDEIGTHFSVLVALRDMTLANGALEVIPRSHKNIVGFVRDARPYSQRELADHFMALPPELEDRRVQIPIKQGEFLIFHSALIHRSLPYSSGEPRVSLAGRLAPSDIVLSDDVLAAKSAVLLEMLA